MFWGNNLLGIFQKGSFAMWPLLLCSVIGFAIILERSIYFFRLRFSYKSFVDQLKKLLVKRKMREALKLCRAHPHPVPRISGLYLSNLHKDELRDEVIKREGSLALEKVEKRLRELATITHIAPLLGLLGTVTGLVTAFHEIQLLGGQVQPSDLASGIWEALITTVFGLVIAIPCMAAYHAFESYADKVARRLQFIVSELDEFFQKHSGKDFHVDDPEATQEMMSTVR